MSSTNKEKHNSEKVNKKSTKGPRTIPKVVEFRLSKPVPSFGMSAHCAQRNSLYHTLCKIPKIYQGKIGLQSFVVVCNSRKSWINNQNPARVSF